MEKPGEIINNNGGGGFQAVPSPKDGCPYYQHFLPTIKPLTSL
jgi:hypothetical protein